MTPRILVAGIGNVFSGDDGFGVEVARRLLAQPRPENVKVADFGIRGIHLVFELLSPLDLLVVVDACPRGGTPGTLYEIEPDVDEVGSDVQGDAHGMDLPSVFARVRAMGGGLPRVLLVGCEPADIEDGMGLSALVEAALDPALALVQDIVKRELRAMVARDAAQDAAKESTT